MSYICKPSDRNSCIFCDALRRQDEESLILYRSSRSFIMINMFPYNTAHVMIAPYRHTPNFELLGDDELLDMMKMVKLALKAIDNEYGPHGYNVGANLGRVAGAGIEGHLHIHIVPRWLGDTSFMPIIAGAKVIPEDLRATYSRLKKSIEDVIRKST